MGGRGRDGVRERWSEGEDKEGESRGAPPKQQEHALLFIW